MYFRVVANYQFLTNFCIDRCRLVPNLCEKVSYVCNTFRLNNTQEETFNFQLFKSSLPDSHTQLVRIAPIINAITKHTHACQGTNTDETILNRNFMKCTIIKFHVRNTRQVIFRFTRLYHVFAWLCSCRCCSKQML